jgi:hypothetical protein
MLGLIRAVEPPLPTLTPRLISAAHAHARPGRRPQLRNGNSRDAREGTLPPRLASEDRTMFRSGPTALGGATTGWLSGAGSRLVRHAKGERKIRSSRSCADWEEMTADMLRVIADLTTPPSMAASRARTARSSNRCGKPSATRGRRSSTGSATATANSGSSATNDHLARGRLSVARSWT